MIPLHSLFKNASLKQNFLSNNRFKKPLLKVALLALGMTGIYLSYEAVNIYQENNRREMPGSAVRHLYGYGRVVKLKYEGPFYHATRTEEAVKSILQEGYVKPESRESVYVSQKWERNYGDYVFVFKDALRTHEDGSARAYRSLVKTEPHAWIGFCRKIPTTDHYLAGIILGVPNNNSPEEGELARAELERKAMNWAGRAIIVEHEHRLEKLKAANIA